MSAGVWQGRPKVPRTVSCRLCGDTKRFPGNTEAEIWLKANEWSNYHHISRGTTCRDCRVRTDGQVRDGYKAARVLQDIVLSNLPARGEGIHFREVYNRVRGDYGSVSERAVYSALSNLRHRGEIERIGYRFSGSLYRRAT